MKRSLVSLDVFAYFKNMNLSVKISNHFLSHSTNIDPNDFLYNFLFHCEYILSLTHTHFQIIMTKLLLYDLQLQIQKKILFIFFIACPAKIHFSIQEFKENNLLFRKFHFGIH